MTKPVVLRRPSPLGRPRGNQFQLWRGPLSRTHLIFLVAAAFYIMQQHPASTGPVASLTAIAILGELTPAAWRKFFIAESLLLIGGVISFLWTWETDHPYTEPGYTQAANELIAFQGWVRIIFVAWLLIPARPGYLRWMAALIAVELCIPPLETQASPRLLLLVLAAVMAIAWDAHLRVAVMRPADVILGRSRRSSALRWSAAACLVVVVLGLPLSLWVHDKIKPNEHDQGARFNPEQTNLETQATLVPEMPVNGGDQFNNQNPWEMAYLEFEERPDDRVYYLRAYALPRMVFKDSHYLTWQASNTGLKQLGDSPLLHDGEPQGTAFVYRRAAINDHVALRPDGCSQIQLGNCIGDIDGNVFRENLGEVDTFYEVEVGDVVAPPASWAPAPKDRFQQLPYDLRRRLEDLVPQITTWRDVAPEIAALSIEAWLENRCSYQLNNLPAPMPSRAGNIMRFMFDEDPQNRVGHCQFFATAAVLLLRAAGHDARCVIGYASEERDGNGIVFRALHAHAWIETLTEQAGKYYWQRFDPTPPDYMTTRTQGVTLTENTIEIEKDNWKDDIQPPTDVSTDNRSFPTSVWMLLSLMVITTVAGCLWWYYHRGSGLDARQRLLKRHTESLVKVAVEIGISVDRSSTLTTIARQVEQRSGIKLEGLLEEHLAARFGDGPLPGSWPISDIRHAMKHARDERQEA